MAFIVSFLLNMLAKEIKGSDKDHPMVAISSAIEVDLTGQVSADSLAIACCNYFDERPVALK